MTALPRGHLLCPFRQRSSWGDAGGDGDVATLKYQVSAPALPSARSSYGERPVSKGFPQRKGPDGAGASEGRTPGRRRRQRLPLPVDFINSEGNN